TWNLHTGDLPDRQILWRFIQDHECPELCFLGAEFGLYVTLDGGQRWLKLTGDVPTISFRDIEIQRRENDLIGASFGRSFFVLDDYSFLRTLSETAATENDFILFPVRKTQLFVPSRPLGSEKGSQGDRFHTAPNPPFGAVLTYYIKDSLKTRQAMRREQEARVKKQGGDTPYPGWAALEEENDEEAPTLTFVIEDRQGNLVDRVTGPTSAGLHRVTWGLRHASSATVGGRGPLVTPGQYRVHAEKRYRGEVTSWGHAQTIRVVPLAKATRSKSDRETDFEFYQAVAALERSVQGASLRTEEVLDHLNAVKRALTLSDKARPDLLDEARRLELQLQDLRERLTGGGIKSRYNEPDRISIGRRLDSALSTAGSSFGPTATHQQDYRIAQEEFDAVFGQLEQCIEKDFVKLQADLEAAGLPWTPGRPIPRRIPGP
ncbi:MAG: glycosyl hydrolase, partial [Phycisphaerae bacterium]|nr:glycosyl hydrolase [Phycisphaerae bacterium]